MGESRTGGKLTTFTITPSTLLPQRPAGVSARIPGACGQQAQDLGSSTKE